MSVEPSDKQITAAWYGTPNIKMVAADGPSCSRMRTLFEAESTAPEEDVSGLMDPNDPLDRLRFFSDKDLVFERRDILAMFVAERKARKDAHVHVRARLAALGRYMLCSAKDPHGDQAICVRLSSVLAILNEVYGNDA